MTKPSRKVVRANDLEEFREEMATKMSRAIEEYHFKYITEYKGKSDRTRQRVAALEQRLSRLEAPWWRKLWWWCKEKTGRG